MQFQDYYKILGVDRSASQDEIKKAYRGLSKKFHPDRNKNAGAEDRFKEVGEAYQVLGDVDARRRYDGIGGNFSQGQPFSPPPAWQGVDFNFSGSQGGAGPQAGPVSGFSDFFDMLFGQQAGGAGSPFAAGGVGSPFAAGGAPRGRNGQDREVEITISLEDSYHGGTRQINLQMTSTAASGGRSTERKQYDVKIPKGITSGKKIRLKGQGQAGLGGGKTGDLLLKVKISPHPDFEIDGLDLLHVLNIAPWEAALGAKVSFQSLDGEIKLSIPKGSQSGRRLRLKGKGLPSSKGPKSTGAAGDLHVELRIVVPLAESEKVQDLYRQLEKATGFDPRSA